MFRTIGNLRGFYRAPDTGGAGGGQEGGEGGNAGGTGDGTGSAGTNAGGEGGNAQITFTAEQQAAIDKLIGERLTRAKTKWESETADAKKKAEEEAEKKRLKEQAEWQKLAEQHEAKVQELEPQVKALGEKVAAYQKAVEELLAAKVKALGDKAKVAVEALPGEPDALARLSWLNANESLFAPADGKGHIGTPPKRAGKSGGTAPGQEDKLPTRPLTRL